MYLTPPEQFPDAQACTASKLAPRRWLAAESLALESRPSFLQLIAYRDVDGMQSVYSSTLVFLSARWGSATTMPNTPKAVGSELAFEISAGRSSSLAAASS